MDDVWQEFRVSIIAANAGVTLHVGGDVDLATAGELRKHLEMVIGASAGDIVVDLSEVTFLDSAGLVVLLRAHRQLADANRRLTVSNPSRDVHRVLELTDVGGILGVLGSALETATE